MRARRLAVIAAGAAFALAGCGGGQESAPEPTEAPAAAVKTEESQEPRTIDPDAPENAVIADGDTLGHQVCETWMSKLGADADLRETVDDVNWTSQQADNEYMSWSLNKDWASKKPAHVRIFCEWNGYEVEEGSPADLLG